MGSEGRVDGGDGWGVREGWMAKDEWRRMETKGVRKNVRDEWK